MSEVEQYGLSATVGRRNTLRARQKRIERQSRLSELRLGLATMASTYRDEAVVAARPDRYLDAVEAILETVRAFALNPNEELALTGLFWKLPPIKP